MDDTTSPQQSTTQDWLIALPDGLLWLSGDGPADLLWAAEAFAPGSATEAAAWFG